MKRDPHLPVIINYWDRHYPNWREQLLDVYGCTNPQFTEIAQCKLSPEKFCHIVKFTKQDLLGLNTDLDKIVHVANNAGVHPYLYDYSIFLKSKPDDATVFKVSFYYEAHAVLFKLAWNNQ